MKLDAASQKSRLARLKLHPRSAFMTGFVRVMGNLGVLLTWIVLAANFMAHDWVEDTLSQDCVHRRRPLAKRLVCALSYAFRAARRFSAQTLLRMQHLSGICLVAFGLLTARTLLQLRITEFEPRAANGI